MRFSQMTTVVLGATALAAFTGGCSSSSSHPDGAVAGHDGGAGAGGTGLAGADGSASETGAGGTGGSVGGAGGTAVDAGGDAGSSWLTRPTVPAALAVPATAVLKAHYSATGAQVYTCTASGGADAGADAAAVSYSWVLKAPDAQLFDEKGTQAGTHFAGPTWMSSDGSTVVGNKVAQADSPLTDAIPWLVLSAKSNTGTGVFSDVTWVQRVNTTKGKAPATACDATSADVRVSYTADYYFYTGAPLPAADGGADGATTTADGGTTTVDGNTGG